MIQILGFEEILLSYIQRNYFWFFKQVRFKRESASGSSSLLYLRHVYRNLIFIYKSREISSKQIILMGSVLCHRFILLIGSNVIFVKNIYKMLRALWAKEKSFFRQSGNSAV